MPSTRTPRRGTVTVSTVASGRDDFGIPRSTSSRDSKPRAGVQLARIRVGDKKLQAARDEAAAAPIRGSKMQASRSTGNGAMVKTTTRLRKKQ